MAKKRCFLGFFASLFILFFTANAFAAGAYVCETRTYTSCREGYYMSSAGVCTQCPENSSTVDKNTASTCTCNTGYHPQNSSSAVSTANPCEKDAESCAENQYLVNGVCKKCPLSFPFNESGGAGGVTSCYAKRERASTGDHIEITPAGCANVTEWQDCTPATCEYTVYSSEDHFSDGAFRDGCETNTNTCNKTPITVTAAANHYVDGATCPVCGAHSRTDAGNTADTCTCGNGYSADGSRNGATTSTNGCLPITYTITYDLGEGGYWPAGVDMPTEFTAEDLPIVKFMAPERPGFVFDGWTGADTTVGSIFYITEIGDRVLTAKWQVASCEANQYLDGGTCRACSEIANGEYPLSDGGTITSGSCYAKKIKTGGQLGRELPANCFSITLKNSCTPGTCEYRDYYDANLTEICTPEDCTKPIDTLTAKAGFYVSNNRSCQPCSTGFTSAEGNTLSARGQCSRSCAPSDMANSAEATGEVFYSGTKNCQITKCKDGYYYQHNMTGGACVVCPANAICAPNPCTGDDCPNPITCGAGYELDEAGTKCIARSYTVTYSCGAGTGTPDNSYVLFNAPYTPKGGSGCTPPTGHAFTGWTISGTSDVVSAGTAGRFTWQYTENKTFTAQYIKTQCDSGEYWDGTQCHTCPAGYYYSDVSADSESKCYKRLENQACVEPTKCPDDTTNTVYGKEPCTFDTSATWSGKQYYGSDEMLFDTDQGNKCPIASLQCKAGYYTNGSVCSKCSGLTTPEYPDGFWDMSLATNNQYAENCFASCSINYCVQKTCPDHATCTHGTERSTGGKYYPNAECSLLTGGSYKTCSITITPDTGYECNDSICTLIVTPVILNRNYPGDDADTTVVATIYQKYVTGWYSGSDANDGTEITKAPLPEAPEQYTFAGYWTAREGGEQVITASGRLPSDDTYETKDTVTLYARWSLNNTNCQIGKYYNGTSHVECPAGSYCPGTGNTPIGTAGCAEVCPTDANGNVASAKNSMAASSCYTTRTGQLLSDKSGHGDQMCYYDESKEEYSANCTISVTSCNEGYYRQADNSVVCSVVGTGAYSPNGDLAKRMCNTLTGADGTVTTETQTSGVATQCYNQCSRVGITNGARVPVNAKEFYNGTQIPACTYTTSCNPGYKPSGTECVAETYAITLNHGNGTANSTIYLKYGDGWYSDAAAKNKIISVATPSNGDGKNFEGYVSTRNDIVVDNTGALMNNYTLFTANATITAKYGNRTAIHCNAGTYYAGAGDSCTDCPEGSYCPGVDTFVGIGEARGINTCASLNGTYVHADGVAAATVITSDARATGTGSCYATYVAYISDSRQASGSQTCHYDQSVGSYSANCIDKQVLRCNAGYYLAKPGDIDCAKVGTAYYSADGATERKACPNKDETDVTTNTETSGSVQECYLAGIWYKGQHSGQRRSCFHTSNENETNISTGYSYNCDVSVIVSCDGGYYHDNTNPFMNNGELDCRKVENKNKYSPAQSFFTDEPAQPSENQPGSSIQLHDCPETKTVDHGTAKRKFQMSWSADDYAVCEYNKDTSVCDEGYIAIQSGNEIKCIWDDPDACPVGFYCPDGSEEPIECPTDKGGRRGTTEGGAKKAEDCFIEYDPYSGFENGTGSATCNYTSSSGDYTRCHDITAKTCKAGYYYRDAGSATCVGVTSGNYSPEGEKSQTPCPVGGNGSGEHAASYTACYKNCEITVAHSATVATKEEKVFGTSANSYAACSFDVTCQTGYSPNNNSSANPTCDANRYTVTLDKNGGVGNVAASVQCTFDSGSCALPATTGLTRGGYTVGTKWCTSKNGTGTCYTAGSSVTTNISASGADITLYAIWTPNVYKITLKHADATVAATPAIAYLKYATGWFQDSYATTALTSLTKVPEKEGYAFSGYKAGNNTVVVDANGMFQTSEAALTFTTADADVNVVWSAGNTKCAAGTYYSGTGSTCLACQDNHYCPGGNYATDAGIAGMNACRDNGKTEVGEAASSETQCFKENLATYVAAHGTGTQTCYFDTAALTYSASCVDNVITACDAGYWLQNRAAGQTAPDCDVVGNGYYSASQTIDRTQCPNGGTTSETTAATLQSCFKSGLDYTAKFGTGTQRCYYSNGDGDAAVYNRECDTKEITKCRGGYWLDKTLVADDCSPVGENNYSETNDIARHACANDGKTNSDITSTPSSCYKDSEVYTATHGGGFRTCYYNVESGLYEIGCETPTLEYCHGGYYSDVNVNEDDCIEVGYGFWSPAATATSMNKAPSLVRTQCAVGETTATSTSDSASACYACPAGMICDPNSSNKPKSCDDATNGTHPKSDPGNTSINGCYRDCAAVTNAESMTGHDYYGGKSTCAVEYCKSGYTYNSTTKTCEVCPAGSICPQPCIGDNCDVCDGFNCCVGDDCKTPKTCSSATKGAYPKSDPGNASIDGCYRDCEEVENAAKMKGHDYYGRPSTCAVEYCKAGYTYNSTTKTCEVCPDGMICPEPCIGGNCDHCDGFNCCVGDDCQPKSCSTATNGAYPKSDPGNTSIDGCYRDCAATENVATMKGHDYYGKPSTCTVEYCKTGYTYNATQKTCQLCPAGSICPQPCIGDNCDHCDGYNCCVGDDCNTPKSCAALGDGSWKYSAPGASSSADCYRKCEVTPLVGGTAVPLEDKAYYDKMCKFKGVDDEGNPCDIEGDKCIVTVCKPSYEMVNGTCKPCNREHALGYKSTGNCIVDSCAAGWHPYGQSCEADMSECDAPNALRAEKQWDYKKNAYGICLVKECEDGFHVSSNACVKDVQECTVEHGIGEKEWNHTTGTWGECVATSCDPGFTNDIYESNEPTKQCGHCKNKFGIKGELAASSYSRGCTISACMYQGELYNLENNECNPICDVNGYEDETGTMKWNPSTHKCERKCKDGYTSW